ncbi:hypothetical protein BDR26DRAFT_893963 [Obelidium mucronatum]|nr:hypothetical protein BDR26DRAFT_893963 [Obelidium mucronatum]
MTSIHQDRSPLSTSLYIFTAMVRLSALFDVTILMIITIGLISDSSNTAANIYAAILVIGSLWSILVACFANVSDGGDVIIVYTLHLIQDLVFSIIGWFCFGGYTGYNIIQYVNMFGFAEWRRTLPVLYQLMYFNVWMSLVLIPTAIVAIPLFLVGSLVPLESRRKWVKEHWKLKRKEEPPAPLVAISTVSPIA